MEMTTVSCPLLQSGTMRMRTRSTCVPGKCLTQTCNLHMAFEENKKKRCLKFETVQYYATFNVAY